MKQVLFGKISYYKTQSWWSDSKTLNAWFQSLIHLLAFSILVERWGCMAESRWSTENGLGIKLDQTRTIKFSPFALGVW